jgi:hypothetical protein
MAACDTGKMILYVRSILWDLNIPQEATTLLYEDNNGCTAMGTHHKEPTHRYQIFLPLRLGGTQLDDTRPHRHLYQYGGPPHQSPTTYTISQTCRLSPLKHSTGLLSCLQVYSWAIHEPYTRHRQIHPHLFHHPADSTRRTHICTSHGGPSAQPMSSHPLHGYNPNSLAPLTVWG